MKWNLDLSPRERIQILEKKLARAESFAALIDRPEWITFLELLETIRAGHVATVMSLGTKNVDYHRGRCAQIDDIISIVANTAASKEKLLDLLRRERIRLLSREHEQEAQDGRTEADRERP